MIKRVIFARFFTDKFQSYQGFVGKIEPFNNADLFRQSTLCLALQGLWTSGTSPKVTQRITKHI
jgi:hypothetical protein